jgi:DNA-binding response OmpR family regulator
MDIPTAASVVLLEDQALIALDVEDMLRNAGFNVVTALSSCAAAMAWLEVNTPDVVIMDVELRDGECMKVAETLYARNIPFVIHSGSLPQPTRHDPIFLKGEWVTKPSSQTQLIDAIHASLATKSGHA